MTQSNLMKGTLLVFTLILCSLSFSSFAAVSTMSNTQTTIEIESSNWFSTFKHSVKRNAKSLKKAATKKARQFKNQHSERNSLQKVAWGIGMIIIGALVTVGSVLTISGWGFVIGLGLIIFGALKIVVGVLSVVF